MRNELTLDDLQKHIILVCSHRGETLIVRPAGSLQGFDLKMFHSEMARIRALMKSGPLKNLIFDLSGARYFGTELISGMVTIGREVKQQGEVVIAEPSTEMRMVLELMKLNQIIPIEETLAVAIRKLVHESPMSWMWRHRRQLSLLAVALFLIGVGSLAVWTGTFNRVWGTVASRHHQLLVQKIEQIESLRQQEDPSRAWERFSRNADALLKPTLEQLRAKTDRGELDEALYQATLAVWQLCVRDVVPTQDALDQAKLVLTETATTISEQQKVSVSKPKLTDSTATLPAPATSATQSEVRDESP